MYITATRILPVLAYLGSLVFSSGAVAADIFYYDPNNYTLDVPPEGGRFSPHQAKMLTKDWDKYGVVRVAVLTDHNFGYEFWSGLQLIEAGSKETYSINTAECHISFCLYVGKIPPGKYFINELYAFSYDATFTMTPYHRKSAPVRNSMGSFQVKAGATTDLGLFGLYEGLEVGRGEQYQLAFLGYYRSDTAALFDKLYHKYQKYFKLGSEVLGWDEDEWEEVASKTETINRMFFADFSKPHEIGGGWVFPTAIGMIYTLDEGRGFSQHSLNTLYMVNTLLVEGERWTAGGEGGRIYISENGGGDWKPVDAFPRDEVVVKLFRKQDVLYALTLSQKQELAKLYTASTDGTEFAQIAKTEFALSDKSKGILAAMGDGIESLTKMYFNRIDLKKIRVHVGESELIAQFNDQLFAGYSFEKKQWRTVQAEQPIHDFAVTGDGVYMMSQAYAVTESSKATRKLAPERFGDLGLKEQEKVKITALYHYPADLGKELSSEELFAAPHGGFYVREDGTKVAVLGLYEDKSSIEKYPPSRLYSIGKDSATGLLHSTEGAAFYFDSDLIPSGGDNMLIDRVAPRIYRLKAGGGVAAYSLYEETYGLLKKINKNSKE
jgi:hypothetical protein